MKALLLLALVACRAREPQTVVFVCDHGSAKSVVAAALFNAAAARDRLPYRAVARGVAPDTEIPPALARALAGDGLAPPAPRPIAFAPADRTAARVVYIGDGALPAATARWRGVPPVGRDYAAARDELRARVAGLIAQLRSADTRSTE
jgi:arsenate reductase (thioredoxin)